MGEKVMKLSDTSCKGPVPHDMLETLMNGIFAFVMTLIVKNNIPLPSGTGSEDIIFFIKFFFSVLSDGFSFIFTFILLAMFYILVFEIMRHSRRVDRIFVYLIFCFLLSIIFIPLTSLLWSISDVPFPYGILFHANILFSGLILLSVWLYVSGSAGIIEKNLSFEYIKNLKHRIAVFPITAIIGIIIDGNEISFGSIPIILLYLIPIVYCIRNVHDY